MREPEELGWIWIGSKRYKVIWSLNRWQYPRLYATWQDDLKASWRKRGNNRPIGNETEANLRPSREIREDSGLDTGDHQ